MTTNPFAAPEADLAQPSPGPDEDEIVRRAHLNHETSIKGFGALYLLSIFGVIGGIFFVFFAAPLTADEPGTELPFAAFGLLYVALSINGVVAGWFMRKLDRRARLYGNIQAGIGLLGFPVGTLISAYVLYLLNSEKGKTVLTETYQGIVQRTPHVKYRTSPIVWAALLLLLAFIGFAVVAPLLSL